jgi:ankyrin repeat protein
MTLESTVEGNTVDDLMLAIAANSLDIVEHILNMEYFTVETTDVRGHTPLVAACAYGRGDIVKLLLDRKADVHRHITTTRITPLHIAAANGFAEVCSILLEQGANASVRDINGSTPLDYVEMSPQPLIENRQSVDRLDHADQQISLMKEECMKVFTNSL